MAVRDVIQSAAGSAGDSKTYIEDVFSTYLYTGNGSTQTITNGIDLAGQGGMVWIKDRSVARNNELFDTARGALNYISSNLTNANGSGSGVDSFTSTGFSLDSWQVTNGSTETYASWTFRKAPKFFDVVTYTGNGVDGRILSHNLGAKPGMVIIKSTSNSSNWFVACWDGSQYLTGLSLNLTNNSTLTRTPSFFTDTTMNLNGCCDIDGLAPNFSGQTYVAYLFAHDTTTDGLIQCGSFTTDGSGNASVTLGWEPQYLMFKRTDSSTGGDWYIWDTMRGMPDQTGTSGTNALSVRANSSASEQAWQQKVTSTGFFVGPGAYSPAYGNATYIYMAIRRGPMRTPTDATKVFAPVTYSGTGGAAVTQTTGFPVDFTFNLPRNNNYEKNVFDRLRGWPNGLYTNLTAAEFNNTSYLAFDSNTGVYAKLGSAYPNVTNGSGWTYVTEAFQRAPGFFDVVCGNWAAAPLNHNLGVVPELIIGKTRTTDNSWYTWTTGFGIREYVTLNQSNAKMTYGSDLWITPTSTQFGFQNFGNTTPAVFYLFASCPGVSKVGSYTGNGSSQTINCGFTNGARFVLIKCTSSANEWYVFDTARGITSGTDPTLTLNNTWAEYSSWDQIDPDSSGFIVNENGNSSLNTSGQTYIYLAIA